MLATFSNTANSAAVLGNQVYGPYGLQRYQQGNMGTNKGFTGQYNDSLSGLDYYNARYYDPKAAVFLSADVKQGNMQGMNPYGYVGGGDLETKSDPTGQRIVDMNGNYAYVTSDGNHGVNIFTFVNVWETYYHVNAHHLIDYVHGFPIDHTKVVRECGLCQLGGILSGMWNKFVAAYHDAANDPLAQLAFGFSGGIGDGNGLSASCLIHHRSIRIHGGSVGIRRMYFFQRRSREAVCTSQLVLTGFGKSAHHSAVRSFFALFSL